MKQDMISSKALRMTFLTIAVLIMVGIWLSGFNPVHWLLYLPAGFLAFAALTGICPGLIINKILLRKNLARENN